MSKETLLERAKKVKNGKHVKRKYTEEELELVEAWLNDEVSNKAVIETMKLDQGVGIYTFIAFGCRQLFQRTRKAGE